jgi:hypothetical protein
MARSMTALTFIVAAAILLPAARAPAAEQVLSGHVPRAVANLQPLGSYLTSYLIAIPPNDDITGDFSASYVNLIVPDTAISSTEIDNTQVPTNVFVPIGNSGYSAARRIELPGAHTITSSLPIEVEVYGFGTWDAYGYIGGIATPP